MDLLNAMAMFVRVVDTGSLSGAARALHVSVPLVSRQLAQLEKELGASLILRTTRKLAVTDAGRVFYEGARRALRDVDEATAAVRGDGEVSGMLTVSAPVVLGLRLVGAPLQAFLRRHPKLRIDLRMEDRLVDLLAEGVDIAIRAGVPPPDSGSIIAHRIGKSEKVLVGAPGYLRAHGVPSSPADLLSHSAVVLLSEAGGIGTWRFVRGGEVSSVSAVGALRTSSLLGVRTAALAGIGLAVIPKWLVEDDLATHALRTLLPGYELFHDDLFAIHRSEIKDAPRVRAFLEFCKQEVPKA